MGIYFVSLDLIFNKVSERIVSQQRVLEIFVKNIFMLSQYLNSTSKTFGLRLQLKIKSHGILKWSL